MRPAEHHRDAISLRKLLSEGAARKTQGGGLPRVSKHEASLIQCGSVQWHHLFVEPRRQSNSNGLKPMSGQFIPHETPNKIETSPSRTAGARARPATRCSKDGPRASRPSAPTRRLRRRQARFHQRPRLFASCKVGNRKGYWKADAVGTLQDATPLTNILFWARLELSCKAGCVLLLF